MKDHVYKLIELTGTSTTSIEDAVEKAIQRAHKTIKNLSWFQVTETRGSIEKGKVHHWQVTIKVGSSVERPGSSDEGPSGERSAGGVSVPQGHTGGALSPLGSRRAAVSSRLRPRFMTNDREPTTPILTAATNDWGAPGHVRTLVLMAATVGGVYLCYRLALPFLGALAWALALAVVFTPFQRWVESKVKRANVAALVSVLLIGGVVLGLVWFVGQRLVVEAATGAETIIAKVDSGEWKQALGAHPRLAPLTDWVVRRNLPETVKAAATWLTTNGAALVKGSVLQAIELLLTFYLLFFFLRDRRSALRLLRSLSPLSPVQMDRLFGRVDDTIYATIYGTLAVSAVQGFLGGLMFWCLGLPAPLLWGVVMGLLAVVPVLGAFVIWVPAALYLAMNGSWGKALMLAVWGCAVVGTIDNLLYPMFVGKRLKLHTVLTFISAVGGLIVFGPAGLILGPVVLTVTIELLEIWRGRPTEEAPASADLAALSRFENEGGPAGLEPRNPVTTDVS